MGYALAGAAQKTGHKATLISASDFQPPVGVEFVGVDSAADMFKAVKSFFDRCDCLIMAAAVSDYTPVSPAKVKIKSGKSLTIKLKPTVDILKWAGQHKKKGQIVVGFALEDKNLRARAEEKLEGKNLDMIIANTPAAIGAEKATVQIKTAIGKWTQLENATKTTMAKRIIRLIENLSK